MCWEELQPGLQGGFVCLRQASDANSMLLFPERLVNRLDVQLWTEEWDHRDGHGTAASLMASAVARVKSQDAFWGTVTTAPLGPGGAGETETRCWCWAESGHCHPPILRVFFHPCWRVFWGSACRKLQGFCLFFIKTVG